MTDVLTSHGSVAIRLMRDDADDYALMARWLTDERVLEYYEGRDNPFPLERIVEKYSPRVLGEDDLTPCFILHNGKPVGYMQYYRHDADDQRDYGMDDAVPNYGMDMFIGEPHLWNRGIGSQAVRLMRDYLFETLRASLVTLDPETWNERAIHVYEKCGFRKALLLPAHELHEGQLRDAWLMVAKNPRAQSLSPKS